MSTEKMNEPISTNSQGRSGDKFDSPLRVVTLIAVGLAALCSVLLVLYEGRGTPPFLLFLFLVWVFSPFFAFFLLSSYIKRWPVPIQMGLYGAMLIISLVSLAIYTYVTLRPHLEKPTAVFLLVPFGSLLATGIVLFISAIVSRRLSHPEQGI